MRWGEGVPFGGISALDRISGDKYLGLSDDRAEKGPVRAYTIEAPRNADGTTGQMQITGATVLTDPAGKRYGEGSVDPEAIRVVGDKIVWTSEGAAKKGIPPAIIVADKNGKEERRFTIPSYHTPVTADSQEKSGAEQESSTPGGSVPGTVQGNARGTSVPGTPVPGSVQGSSALGNAPGNSAGNTQSQAGSDKKQDPAVVKGVRDNEAYEGLSINAKDGTAAVLTEDPLAQDPNETGKKRTRLTMYNYANGQPVAEYAYPLDTPTEGADNRGATEILAISGSRFLTLERSYIPGKGTFGTIYQVDVTCAQNVLGTEQLSGAETPVAKTKVLDLGKSDNVEGLSWGPQLADGSRSLLVISDNNFNPQQQTLLHSVAIKL